MRRSAASVGMNLMEGAMRLGTKKNASVPSEAQQRGLLSVAVAKDLKVYEEARSDFDRAFHMLSRLTQSLSRSLRSAEPYSCTRSGRVRPRPQSRFLRATLTKYCRSFFYRPYNCLTKPADSNSLTRLASTKLFGSAAAARGSRGARSSKRVLTPSGVGSRLSG